MDYLKALNYLKNEKKQFDLIFLDPPYKTNYIEKSIELITKNQLLTKIVYGENYKIVKEKKYGDKWVVILKQI